MLIEENGFIRLKGRVGDWVIYQRCGKTVVRRKPERKAPMSDECIGFQHRISALSFFWKAIKAAGLSNFWTKAPDIPAGQSGYNLFVRRNLAAFGADGHLIAPGKLQLTAPNNLQLPDEITLSAKGDAYTINWKNTGDYPQCHPTDEVVVAAMRGGKWFDVRFITPDGGKAQRQDGKMTFTLGKDSSSYRLLYFFMQAGEKVSACAYLHIP